MRLCMYDKKLYYYLKYSISSFNKLKCRDYITN